MGMKDKEKIFVKVYRQNHYFQLRSFGYCLL